MLTYDTKFAQLLAKLIADRVEGITEEMALGQLPDYPAYVRHAARIQGLKEALDLFEEAEAKLKER